MREEKSREAREGEKKTVESSFEFNEECDKRMIEAEINKKWMRQFLGFNDEKRR